MKANDLRPGTGIKISGKLYVVVKTGHVKPGKGPAYIQAKFKDVVSGNNIERRFGSTEDVEEARLDRREMEYLYSDGSGATFMDLEDFDQFIISETVLGDALLYLTPNTSTNVLCNEGNPVVIELPASVELEISDTIPAIKGATATNQLKEATCETGLKTRVPPFIATGEKIRVATVDGSYQSRA
jgi:elongation factor P